ncbi:MAG: transcriptional regulator [Gammaproteobacteria bacterium]|mgnify:FL=1|jgi:ATP-dependent DNA helicase RecG|nr:transcriptional regulator [Gammaproteobacteria bacterium]MBT4608378.1 transcriptional regulator [Thiotrichales bacterium]MBT4079282.1 transcriptional regulator [Gammaproteobacteria bacterium]MBT4329566.1 transcriptional regulator [Gammaproteobacteria bacterium]MBT4811564.1 transcriptional regulator [Thiotrichales bacterium]
MEAVQLQGLLVQLVADWESEVVEFKSVKDSYSTSDIGKYFSALSNEANLRDQERAWLVFGVDDRTRQVVGSDYRKDHGRLQSLKHQITQGTTPAVTLREIHELETDRGRVILFEIPAAPQGMPIAWQGYYHARAGESLTALGVDKQDEIRAQGSLSDWSAQIIDAATLSHLDLGALQKAREGFLQKYANRFGEGEVSGWSDAAFLDRARLTIEGRITRAALLLLGKAESAYLLLPHPAQLTWKLEGVERAYEHFGPPFLLNTTTLYQRIRNIQMRILPEDELLAIELAKYDQKIVLEALHNCIVHQDYARNGRITVTEQLDRLILENEGGFFEGLPGDYIAGHKTPRRYRNPFLAQAMAELNMIDTMGYGIHEMFLGQRRRYFPMPDYDLSESDVVKMTIHGKVVDPAFSRMLIQNSDLSLDEVLSLDRVQKRLPLDDEAMVRHLRRSKLIEGRKPNLYISAKVAAVVDSKEAYIHTRGQDDQFYSKLILDYLANYQSATRKDINKLLWNKLSDALDDDQKENKVAGLLTNMRRRGEIKNIGSRRAPNWVIAE